MDATKRPAICVQRYDVSTGPKDGRLTDGRLPSNAFSRFLLRSHLSFTAIVLTEYPLVVDERGFVDWVISSNRQELL